MKYIICKITVLIMLFASCENEGYYYQDEARIRLEAPYEWALGTDSLEYSFVTFPDAVAEYTLPVTAILMGEAVAVDRTVNIVVVAGLTTAGASHYQLPAQIVLPANSYSVTLPVTLKRTADLQNAGVRLFIQVAESPDFKPGVKERNHLLLKWNDVLSRPNNWDELVEFFGTFSLVKYRFMLNNTGVPEFSAQTMSWAQLMNYRIILRTILNEYNDAHPGNPLRDENGQYVTF
ncbi:MAG: DUF4843 domain-containing protein [Prevotellaceae bacterium]|nr:DUF4843 domain-containing protein [Prevotellaceae bacterium]